MSERPLSDIASRLTRYTVLAWIAFRAKKTWPMRWHYRLVIRRV